MPSPDVDLHELRLAKLTVLADVPGGTLTFSKGKERVQLTARELDEVCHWAMARELLPVLMAEIRGLIRTGGTR